MKRVPRPIADIADEQAQLLHGALDLATAPGEVISNHVHGGCAVVHKAGASPVTWAHRSAEAGISDRLAQAEPGIAATAWATTAVEALLRSAGGRPFDSDRRALDCRKPCFPNPNFLSTGLYPPPAFRPSVPAASRLDHGK